MLATRPRERPGVAAARPLYGGAVCLGTSPATTHSPGGRAVPGQRGLGESVVCSRSLSPQQRAQRTGREPDPGGGGGSGGTCPDLSRTSPSPAAARPGHTGSSMARLRHAGCCWGLILLWAAARAEIHYATVYWMKTEKTIQVKDILDRNGDAYGFYNDTIQSTGWGILEIRAGYGSQSIGNERLMYAAGFLEGYLTAPRMYDHTSNLYPQLIKNPTVLSRVQEFMGKQDKWTRQQIKNNKDDPFWRHAGYVIAQLDGLYMGAQEWAKHHKQRVLPGYENIYFAHSSWFTYAATLRIYKHWDFNITDPKTVTGRMSFSSYPGFLMSLDDFYLLGSGLVMLQTTNNVFNQTLLKQVVPKSLFAWQRVRIANMMADSGKTWAQTFLRCNSGTYNNQYMVLDMKKVKLQGSLDDGALYIIEQIPTLVEYSDQTSVLRKGYWPSYNIPFHETIYNLSGYAKYVEKYGLDFSYDLAPRAKIFRRDQGKVADLESMKYIMRYNNYMKEPYAKLNPCNTICCREDLNPSLPVPAGCYDSKVADFHMASVFAACAVNGPPVEDGLPVFSWKKFNGTRHQGLPEFYNFDFVTMRPIL
ncbi:phospholipase B-like 1 isoform X2 [Chrysemys picta bellii]|uniref:phospholipase B-like 1 isoform X2 n=1 Tax=Chrysemys picta bellii TaxID=8478 RepID=UPI0032B2125D